MKKTNSAKKSSMSSATKHQNVQKSTTLKRQYVSRPTIDIKKSKKSPSVKKSPAKSPNASAASIETFLAAPAIESAPVAETSHTTETSPVEKAPIDEYTAPVTPPLLAEEPLHSILITPPSTGIISGSTGVTLKAPSEISPAEISAAFAQPAIEAPEEIPDLPPEEHPYQALINQVTELPQQEETPPPTPRELKNEAIKTALRNLDEQRESVAVEKVIADNPADDSEKPASFALKSAPKKPSSTLEQSFKRERRHSSFGKFFLAFTTSALCIGILGYFVSLNMPSISVRVAAMQTGIDASYPSYIPRGYQLSSVTTGEGINIAFVKDTTGAFSITEEKSSWDSNALLNNYVKLALDDNYTTLREQGITIYLDESRAAWVNGGILYKLSITKGSLTKKQIKNIALSF